ncbi:hydroxyacylglutathione hydrolase [Legionella wadsworthii]|uniref:Hydroxyacylglutathione hydrolase n=1 Tax=Legionella wadsworthii TaxID=28088 RepID=A0A378LXH1_9GAMM|nr:MBL fold metallo-hydrolase [Legionella wadsworthii]STY31210.1 hydroxyacylglutathione hydrolase [Legionella wadsworthii]
MLFRQLFDNESCTYTYLLASGKGREAIIIDPVKSKTHLYIQLLNQLDIKLVASIETHLHADHLTAAGDLYHQTDCQLMMGMQTKAECVSVKFQDNETLEFDGLKLKAIYTPGHTDDSYCFIMNDIIFTGDTLLIRGTGRTDFQNGSPSMQYDSLFEKILTLPGDTRVYPAHDYHGMTVSTIAEEKHFNPRLQIKSRDEYIELMNNLNLPPPKMIDVALKGNLKCGLTD